MKVASLNVYPVKSARGIAISEAFCGLSGLSGDRIALFCEPDGQAITQRDMPAFARLTVTPEKSGLRLAIDGEKSIIAAPGDGPRHEIRVWADTVSAASTTKDVDAALSDWFGRPLHLAFFDSQSKRTASRDWVDSDTPVSFADGFQILVTTTGSLEALNADLAAHGEETVGMERFRPNIVIDCDEPWAEDGWSSLAIGDLTLDLVKPCARCIMTTQDQMTGSREGANPLKAMGRIRMSADRRVPGPLFGWNAVPRGEGHLNVGDTVTVKGQRAEGWLLKKRRA